MRSDERKQKAKNNKKSRVRGFIIFIVILAILAIGAYTGVKKGIDYVYGKLDKLDHRKINESNLQIDKDVDKELKGFTNIAVFGIDTREGEDDEKCRTDAIIVASINNKTKEVKLISVHRDSYFSVNENGYDVLDKTNHAHAYGGPEGAMATLNKNMDLNIKDFVRVNWKTVADTVDAMGGIELPVKDYEIDELNKYIKDTNKNLHGDGTLITKAGTQTLNGIQAVTYCRIRHVGKGDIERAERMRRTLEALIKKVKTMSLKELNDLADVILPQITTSLDNDETFDLLLDAGSFKIENEGTFPYLSDGFYYENLWYEPPVTLESNVIELHNSIFDQKPYVPTDTVLNISKQIIDRTGYDDSSYRIYKEGE